MLVFPKNAEKNASTIEKGLVITAGMQIQDHLPERSFGHFLIHIHHVLPASGKGLKQQIPHA